MKPETKKRFDWIRKIEADWEYKLGLGDWSIQVDIVKNIDDEISDDVAGKCWPKWQYKNAYIQLKRRRMIDMTEKEIEPIIIHELLHCIVVEMRSYGLDPDHEERVITNLTNAFRWTKEGRKP